MALIVYQRLSMLCQTWLRYAGKAPKKWLSWLMETMFLYMASKVMLFFSYKSQMNSSLYLGEISFQHTHADRSCSPSWYKCTADLHRIVRTCSTVTDKKLMSGITLDGYNFPGKPNAIQPFFLSQ